MRSSDAEKRLEIINRLSMILIFASMLISYWSKNRLPWCFSIYLLFIVNLINFTDSCLIKSREKIVFNGILQILLFFIIYKLMSYDMI